MSIEEKLAEIESRLGKADGTMDVEEITLLHQNLDVVVAFKDEICSKAKEIDATEEHDWFSISLGFFIAKGIVGTTFPVFDDPEYEEPESEDEEDGYDTDGEGEQEQRQFLDAHSLACKVRYTYHYWN